MDLTTLGIILAILSLIICIFMYVVPWSNLKLLFVKITLDEYIAQLNLRKMYTVAIIDDEIESFPIDFIRSMDFDVKTYESISFADSLKMSKFDVVLLDVKGVVKEDPDEGGAKFIKILKEARSLLPIVAVSSGKFQAELNDYFKISDAIINKPIEEFKIREVLTELKADFFDIDILAQSLKERIRKLPIEKKQKFNLEIQIVKYFSTQIPKEDLMQSVHQIATVDSENIIQLINIIKDRLDND